MRTAIICVGLWCALAASVRGEIKVGDSLQIYIRGVPAAEKAKVEGRFVVGPSGTIRIPIVDVAITAKGTTAERLARQIEALYRKAEIYTRPNIEVVGGEAPGDAKALVSVGGRVKRAGPVPYRPGMTLLQAIQAAGDLDTFGTKKRIFVTRGRERRMLDLRTAEGQGYVLRNGDTVVVDQRKWHETQ